MQIFSFLLKSNVKPLNIRPIRICHKLQDHRPKIFTKSKSYTHPKISWPKKFYS